MRVQSALVWVMCVLAGIFLEGCSSHPSPEEECLGKMTSVLNGLPNASGTGFAFSVEQAGDGFVVAINNLDAIFWVSGETVYADNVRAMELCPNLPKAPYLAEIKRAERIVTERGSKERAENAEMQGMDLTAAQAEAAEKELADDPSKAETRAVLLGYYFFKQFDSEDLRAKCESHALWFIEHMPNSYWAGMAEVELDPHLNTDAYAKACGLWDKYTASEAAGARLLGNAANFFVVYDKERSERFLKRCIALEPESPEWHGRLAFLYMLHLPRVLGDQHTADARMALEHFLKAMELAPSQEDRDSLVEDTAHAALEANEFEQARGLAERLLSDSEKHAAWDQGNAVHYGNITLGQLALRQGDIENAKKYLLEAGKTKGSPQLDSFGPDLELAQSLLERGEKETVREYLRLCGKFWDEPKVEEWRKSIASGGTPRLDQNE